jgi:hypothetical protein
MIPSTNQTITVLRNLLAAAPAHRTVASKVRPQDRHGSFNIYIPA